MFRFTKNIDKKDYRPHFGAVDIFKYIGPGLLVTVGFIDPGNWATNLAAGADFGYTLLWVVTLSTIALIVLQHNVAHLGIATGLCLSEAAAKYVKPSYARWWLSSAMVASVSTSLAEILGGAIALNMLFSIPVKIGAIMVMLFALMMLLTNSYRFIERWIIAFVSMIGISFIYELTLVDVNWADVGISTIIPRFPNNSIVIIMSILGAVVMPHNLFLHSEVIQSRQWHLKDEKIIKKQLKYEFYDTLFSMWVGWGINSAIIILAASTFFKSGTQVTELQQAKDLLSPLLGNNAAMIFAIALLFSGLSSTITSGMSGGIIFAGMHQEPYDIKDNHSKLGVAVSFILAILVILFISNPLQGLIISQMLLSIQLPFTIFLQVYLTSSPKVMGKYKNNRFQKSVLYFIGIVISALNVYLMVSIIM